MELINLTEEDIREIIRKRLIEQAEDTGSEEAVPKRQRVKPSVSISDMDLPAAPGSETDKSAYDDYLNNNIFYVNFDPQSRDIDPEDLSNLIAWWKDRLPFSFKVNKINATGHTSGTYQPSEGPLRPPRPQAPGKGVHCPSDAQHSRCDEVSGSRRQRPL